MLGQEKVDVTLLVPDGVEPHDWGPTIKDVQRIQNSDLIIINGIGFENWVDNLDETDYQGVIVDTSDEILDKNLSQEHIFWRSTYLVKSLFMQKHKYKILQMLFLIQILKIKNIINQTQQNTLKN